MFNKKKEPILGYCVKCRAKREMIDPKPYTMKNNKPASLSICQVCGTKIFRIGKMK